MARLDVADPGKCSAQSVCEGLGKGAYLSSRSRGAMLVLGVMLTAVGSGLIMGFAVLGCLLLGAALLLPGLLATSLSGAERFSRSALTQWFWADTRLQQLLRSGIAIDRMTRLQSELTALESEMADLHQQIPRLRDVIENQARLKRQIGEQVELIGRDVLEREDVRKFAVQAFAEVSRYLYDAPGNLIIGRSKGIVGLEIDTDIVGKKSGGKSHMQVFCFDWMLAQAANRYDRSPKFLIHDSHIFDGVDGRQIGLALSYADQKSRELGIQYVVAMNSDDLDKIKNEEAAAGEPIFDPSPFIMETRLSDDEAGGLFGLRF